LILRHLQRAFFYPHPRCLPDAVDESIDATMKRFENTLDRHAPDALAALQPGLADERIREIELRYRLRLTDDLRALYRWRNGSAPDERIELIPGHWFVPLEHAAEQREVMRQQVAAQTLVQRIAYWVFAGHRTKWLAVLDDLCGDGYFYDPARWRQSGNFFYHFAEDRQYRFFPSLANFLVGAIECYESGIYRSGRPGRDGEDFGRSFELWGRYAAWPRT
jgi:cell wall assembly regulator SMI1